VADPNRELFESVVQLLRPVLDEFVFVGGCTTGLLNTDPAASDIRPTKDVDAIVDVTSYAKYAALSDVLGFSNRWYPAAVETAQTLSVAGHDIRVVTPVYFVAAKLEAFHGRGADDVTLSHDLEDIIAVIDGRAEIVDDIGEAEPEVRKYIALEIGALLENEDFVEVLSGFLLPNAASQGRRPLLEQRLRAIAGAA